MKCSHCKREAVVGIKLCAVCRENNRLSNLKFRQNNLESCKTRTNELRQQNHLKLKNAVFAKLGSCCARCGFSDRRALQIDHVNGGGSKERKTMASVVFLSKVLADTSGNYQILCANCNWIKRIEQKEYPTKSNAV